MSRKLLKFKAVYSTGHGPMSPLFGRPTRRDEPHSATISAPTLDCAVAAALKAVRSRWPEINVPLARADPYGKTPYTFFSFTNRERTRLVAVRLAFRGMPGAACLPDIFREDYCAKRRGRRS